MGIASLVECSAVGALGATLAALYKKNLNRDISIPKKILQEMDELNAI